MKTQNTKLIAFGKNKEEYEFSVNNSYEYSHWEQKLKVELIEEADGFTILSCNGVRYPVEILSQKQNSFEVLVNGVSYSFLVETPFSLKRNHILSSQNKKFETENITAPMPGKILNILVVEGQTINNGEALLVLEAMKMQNVLVTNVKGVVTKLFVKTGNTVGKDDLLVEIKSM